MFIILLLLFTIIPAVEIYLLFTVGSEIGSLNTIFIIIMTGVLGAGLAKSQGLQIIKEIQGQMNSGTLPGDQVIQGLMVFAGGLLLLTPGFLTDILGFLLVMPGTRHLLMIFIKKFIGTTLQSGMQSGNRFYSFSSSVYTNQGPKFNEELETKVSDDIFEAEYTKKDL